MGRVCSDELCVTDALFGYIISGGSAFGECRNGKLTGLAHDVNFGDEFAEMFSCL